MQTLSYGFKLPETGDKGSTWFPALEDNINQLNDHSHNGTDSALISTQSIEVITNSIASGSWVSLGGGNYRQLVTVPAGFNYDNCVVKFKDSSGNLLMLSQEKVTTTTYYVYINDNSLTLTAYYGS